MSRDSRRSQPAISYPIGPNDSQNDGPRTWAKFGWLATIAFLLVGGVSGYIWNQQEASPSPDFRCEEVRALAQDAEHAAVSTLAKRNLLVTELDELPQFLTQATIDRGYELRSEIPTQESRVLFGYSGWQDALNQDRECFGRADLIFAESRIHMVSALFE